MAYSLPTHNIPIDLVIDIVTYINKKPNYILKDVSEYVGCNEMYTRSGINIAKLLGILDDERNVDAYINTIGTTPNESVKLDTMRKYIQEFEPFVTFIQFMLNDNSPADSARKVYTLYEFTGKDSTFLMNLFTSWGKTTGIFRVQRGNIEISEEVSTSLKKIEIIDLELNDDMAIRVYINQRLGDDVFPNMTPAEITELTDAFKKHETDPRGSIECAGRAFEDFLRRTAVVVGVDVTGKNGIGQIINTLYNNKDAAGTLQNKVHNKQYSIGNAIGDIRNMAGHSLEARTMERWDLVPKSSLMYVELVLSTIRSIYYYVKESRYTF